MANLAAIGTCAQNIVLLGDQMQLGQPIQGVHPGRSGESSLEYLLDGLATVPPDRGIFLPTTWRMCPDVCRFISEAVYDGRLEPEPKNANQTLVLGAKPHPALQPTGVVFWPMDHAGCAQKSAEEAQEIERIYQSLLKQASWIDREGVKRRITPDDILVVAPYNMQVKLLQRTSAGECARGHGGQVPGPGGGGVDRLDDDLERGGPAPAPRVSVQQEPAERGDLAGADA